MKNLFYVATVLALTALPASAYIETDPAEGALRMTFRYWPDGSGSLKNTHTAIVQIDSYELWSVGNNLDPVGWVSLDDFDDTMPGMIELANALGMDAVGFGEGTAVHAGYLVEVHGGGYAEFEVGESWGIGNPVSMPVPDVSDLSFYYTMPGYVDVKFLGLVEYVPEPATMGLLCLGGLSVVIRRRRRQT
ncbi:MAG: PEP-CTERM sorting domain-containing protein [Planctomycetota bacterium]